MEEKELFELIGEQFSSTHQEVEPGKMMSSPALTFRGKVFCFISRKNRMVFKLGNDFDGQAFGVELNEFNPFSSKGPLRGWYELSYDDKEQWEPLARKALQMMRP
ncbi:MAG: hypothetical protein KI790_11610 [Cyclobacteriaceae bacterium]|nr:hypothetical protein [Cyclobacteriaceae bacterium HetDA_MAG_MS6]